MLERGRTSRYTAPAGKAISFFYDHRTKNIQNTTQGDLVAAAGSFQSEQGCVNTAGEKEDWAPSCLRAWLGDPDGDKIFTWTGTRHPRRATTSSRSR